MIWRVVERYAELADAVPQVSEAVAYATFDGLFQQFLLRHLAGRETAADELGEAVPRVVKQLFCTA
jgi:hypothetical protein